MDEVGNAYGHRSDPMAVGIWSKSEEQIRRDD
jgi:hypothetical protein